MYVLLFYIISWTVKLPHNIEGLVMDDLAKRSENTKIPFLAKKVTLSVTFRDPYPTHFLSRQKRKKMSNKFAFGFC